MKLVSLNVSLPVEVTHAGRVVKTGIFKRPVGGPVMMRKLGLDGDGQADLEVHGGVDKAVYAYTIEHYAPWRGELRREDLEPGQFGENLTVEGMPEHEIHVGDVFALGEAVIQVTQPRVPCHKLGIKMGLPEFPKHFLASGRVGFYVKVLEEGAVTTGDSIESIEFDPERMSVREILALRFGEVASVERLHKALRIAALPSGWKTAFEEQLGRSGNR